MNEQEQESSCVTLQGIKWTSTHALTIWDYTDIEADNISSEKRMDMMTILSWLCY